MNKNASTLGWVDFNKKDRDVALKLIEENKTQGSVDELGLGIIRDAFSDVFFPGITTIQTRARYFLVVPYWLKLIADKKISTVDEFEIKYFEKEKEISKKIFEHCGKQESNGIFGVDTFNTNRWLVRTILETYWNGIWKFGLIKNNRGNGHPSISDSMRIMLKQKEINSSIRSDDEKFNSYGDDERTKSEIISINKECFEIEKELDECYDINLNKKEAIFLQKMIRDNASESLLSYAVDSNSKFDIIDDFDKIDEKQFPALKDKIIMAKEFRKLSRFLGIRFNHLINRKDDGWDDFPQIEKGLIDRIFDDPDLALNRESLKMFVENSLDCIINHDGDGLDALIKEREKKLKGNRAKTILISSNSTISNGEPVSFDYDYRLNKVNTLVQDIKKGLGIK